MASFVFTDAVVTINSVALSGAVRSATLNVEADVQEDTAMGDTYRSKLGGLKDWTLELEFNQDFAASQIDATLWPLLGTTTTVKIKPTSAATSATNPEYSGTALLSEYPPLDGSVGDVATVSVTFEGAGALTRATT